MKIDMRMIIGIILLTLLLFIILIRPVTELINLSQFCESHDMEYRTSGNYCLEDKGDYVIKHEVIRVDGEIKFVKEVGE